MHKVTPSHSNLGSPRRALAAALLGTSALLAGPALAESARLPTIAPADYNAEQALAAQEFLAIRKTPVFGPFEPLMHSPQMMSLARAMGDYLRYKPAIGTTLSELAILVTARHWSQGYEWFVHYPAALKAGIPASVADPIGLGQRPAQMTAEQTIVYDFATELNQQRQVSDATFARAEKQFGKQGVVDLAGICGYYTLLAMELNMARYPVPALPDGANPGAVLPVLKGAAP